MELIAFPRPPETDHGNLFVRLSSLTARRLADLADGDGDGGPTINLGVVEFLPLEITVQPNSGSRITVYGSYNGGEPAASSLVSMPYRNGNTENIIELPHSLHPTLKQLFSTQLTPPSVLVRAINPPIAQRITFEPLTVSDWEMIEMEAEALEDGGLLGQVSVVYFGQVLPLRLTETSLGGVEGAAWVRVVDEGEFCDEDFESDSSISSSDNEAECNHERSVPCVRLMAETEVIVIPKPRNKSKQTNAAKDEVINSPSEALRVQPTVLDYPAVIDVVEYLPTPRVGGVYVHSSTAAEIPGYKQCSQEEASRGAVVVKRAVSPHASDSRFTDDQSDSIGGTAIAKVCVDNRVKEGHIALHPLLRYQLQLHPYRDWISFQLLPDSFVANRVNSLRDAMDDRGEGIRIKKVNLVVDKIGLPWRFPELDNSLCDKRTTYTCENCQNASETIQRTLQLDSPILFCHGSLMSAEHMRELGMQVQGHDNDLYRVDFPSSLAGGAVGPIIGADDLAQWLDCLDEGDVQVDARADSSSPELLNNSPESITLSDESILTFGMAATPPIGVEILERTVISSALEILSRPPMAASDNYMADPSQMFIGITGEEGTGKTHCATHIASKLSLMQKCAIVYLGCKKLQSSTQSTLISILEEIQRVFNEARYNQPSVVIFDDLDCLIPNVESGSSSDGSIQHQMTNPALISQVKVIVDHLLLLSSSINGGVVCICTFKDNSSLSGRFMQMLHSLVKIPSLDAPQRIEFLCQHLLEQSTKPNEVPHFISRLGRLTDGYRPRDLKTIVTQICHDSKLRDLQDPNERPSSKNLLLEADIDSILHNFVPLSQQSLDISHNENIVDWHSIGGLFRAKQSLHDTVIHPMKFRRVYNNAPTKLPTGLLIFGYPGCGKSFIVPSLAKVSNLNLITCRGPELLDRYIGASEAKVRQLFARAAAASPALLFFDEFDSLAPQRGSDHTGVTDRVVNQLLTLLDGAERNTKSQIFVIAATSRPDKIDNALLRPGRLEKHVFVGHPESESEWNSLFSSILMSRNVDQEVKSIQEKGDLFNSFCQGLDYAKGFCAADLKAVLDTAHLTAVHEILDEKMTKTNGPHEVIIGRQHIMDAFRRTRPSLLLTDRLKFQRFFKPFLGDNVTMQASEWNTFSAKSSNNSIDTNIKLKTALR